MKNYICSVKSLFLLTLVSLVFGLGINVQVSNAEVLNDGSGNFKILSRTSIQNPKLISQIGNNFVISFDMSNKENAQPDLKYGLQLIEESENGQVIADEKIFSEIFTLGPNETITREVNYTAPSYLVGEYSIWLIIENSSGLNQGIGTVGKVQLLGDDQYVEIDISSCYLSVTEDNLSKKYNLQQGVDEVVTETTYTLTCFNELGTSVTTQTTPADYIVLSAKPNDVGINFDLATGTTEPEVELNFISWNGFKDPITITSDILTALPESPGDETTNHLIITPDRVYSFTDYYTNNLKPLLEIFASYRFIGSKTVQVSATDSNPVNINILGESTVPIYEPF